MIPSTIVGLAVFAATVAPGRLFERRAEKLAPRPPRSAVAEVAELVVIGELMTIFSVLVVALVAEVADVIDVGAFVDHPAEYFEAYALEMVVVALVTLLLSLALADAAARVVFRVDQPTSEKGGYRATSVWYDALWRDRPTDEHGAVATVELKNGFRITGQLDRFTADSDAENREVGLRAPILMRAPGGAAARFEGGDFVLLREDEIRFIAGRYTPPS